MKQPRIRIIPLDKTPKRRVKLMEEYVNWLVEQDDFKRTLRTLMRALWRL